MFLPFFLRLREEKVPVTLREYLALLEGLEAGLVDFDPEGFYYLARTTLVKDERFIDRFDRVFSEIFGGILSEGSADAVDQQLIPEDWLRRLAEKHLSDEDKKLIESLGGFDTDGNAEKGWPNRRSAIRAATSGSARPAPRPSAPMATIRKACASARRKAAIDAR